MSVRIAKRCLKWVVAEVCVRSGLADRLRRAADLRAGSPRALILMYHRVVPSGALADVQSLPQIVVTAETFERQMAFLVRRYRPTALSELVALRKAGRPFPDGAVVVTFDDGWEDNHRHAMPVLRRHGIPATVFVTTGFIGTDAVFWPERLRFGLRQAGGGAGFLKAEPPMPPAVRSALSGPLDDGAILRAVEGLKYADAGVRDRLIERLHELSGHAVFPLKANRLLTWEEVRDMASAGVAFGSHGETHRILTRIPLGEAATEIRFSGRRLEQELGCRAGALAYPNGDVDDDVAGEVARAGYEVAVTTEEGFVGRSDDVYRLKRVNVNERRFSGPRGRYAEAIFAAMLAGVL